MAEVDFSRFILVEFRKALEAFQKHIVVPVITYAGNLSAHGVPNTVDFITGVLLTPELVNGARRDAQALSGFQADLLSRGESFGNSVNSHLEFLIARRTLRIGGSELNDNIAPGAIDDVFSLGPVIVGRSALPFRVENELLGVSLRVERMIYLSVSESEERASDFMKAVGTKIGHIPAQHAVSDFISFWAGLIPVGHTPACEGGE